MDDIVRALAEQQAELSRLLEAAGDPEWRLPTRCEGWDVADVVVHLIQTNEMAMASLQRRFAEDMTDVARDIGGPAADVDEGAALMVASARGQSPDTLRSRWREGADALQVAFAGADLHERVQWVAGELTVRTLATTRLAETWIHTGDVAGALGVDLGPSDRLRHIARLAWRTLPYAFARAGREPTGPVAFSLHGPNGDAWDFVPDEEPATRISGDGYELCLVAARRLSPAETGLVGDGPDAAAVLDLVRTYA